MMLTANKMLVRHFPIYARTFCIAAAMLALCGQAFAANTRVFSARHGNAFVPVIRYASNVGFHRDITTTVRPLSDGGFTVSARFSQGNPTAGTHMCSAVNLLDAQKAIVGQVRQRAGINATYGGKTNVDTLHSKILLSKSDFEKVTFVEIGQYECPSPTNWTKVIQYTKDAITIIAAVGG